MISGERGSAASGKAMRANGDYRAGISLRRGLLRGAQAAIPGREVARTKVFRPTRRARLRRQRRGFCHRRASAATHGEALPSHNVAITAQASVGIVGSRRHGRASLA